MAKSKQPKVPQAENLSQTRREHANEIAEDYVEAIRIFDRGDRADRGHAE